MKVSSQNQSLYEKVQPFAHTKQAWGMIDKEMTSVRETTDKYLKSGTAGRDEVKDLLKSFKDLRKTMMANIGNDHLISPYGDDWTCNKELGGITPKYIAAVFDEVTPLISDGLQSPTGEKERGLIEKDLKDLSDISLKREMTEVDEHLEFMTAHSFASTAKDGLLAKSLFLTNYTDESNRDKFRGNIIKELDPEIEKAEADLKKAEELNKTVKHRENILGICSAVGAIGGLIIGGTAGLLTLGASVIAPQIITQRYIDPLKYQASSTKEYAQKDLKDYQAAMDIALTPSS